MEDAEADLAEIAAVKGWNSETMEMAKSILVFGDADTVGERLQTVMDAGLDGLTVDLPVNGHKLDRIALLGEIGWSDIVDLGDIRQSRLLEAFMMTCLFTEFATKARGGAFAFLRS